MAIVVEYGTSSYNLSARIILVVNGKREGETTVHRDRSPGSRELGEPKVNWSAWGSVGIPETKMFLEMLERALQVAEEMKGTPKLYEITGETRSGEVFTERTLATKREHVLGSVPPSVKVIQIREI